MAAFTVPDRDPEFVPGPALMDITAVAERLGVQVRHVRRLVNERRIPFIKWGHLLRFDPAEIEGWLDRSRITEAAPPPHPVRR